MILCALLSFSLYIAVKSDEMKRQLSFFALLGLLIFASCQKEQSPITYPENGLSGPNILAANRVSYPANVSLEADLGESNQLRVVIKGVTSYTRRDTLGQLPNGTYNVRNMYFGIWRWPIGKQHNTFIEKMEYADPFLQQVQSIDNAGKMTAQLSFDAGYAYIIEIYENNASQPTRVKQIEVE